MMDFPFIFQERCAGGGNGGPDQKKFKGFVAASVSVCAATPNAFPTAE
jgi:hypothetical protein